ncbi:GIY-YIG nuclease family protein [Methylorubrum sp. Q1]|uniref:GIY-YIG nuclease family protein n=1 Tax=Methylorubrum sp. Q1 TaxID=2562453 RepID=UPI0010766213|nr:GIY-YIG nuclease family protein [Methylorubrum sp. Q1]TFZ57114.1 GIY-YIG nuclease family protein [Methylorubrum sp. Q1]
MPFNLKSILDIEDATHFKFHAARWNGEYQPLDVFTRDREEWVGWNRWRGKRDDFNRRYIISFIDFYPERHAWLFGGMFEVIARQPVEGPSYEITACEQGSELIGRLKISLELSRGKSFKFEGIIDDVVVTEVLKEPYSGDPFAGFDNVSLDFSMLETIIRNGRLDWRTALQNIKGVYLIVDKSSGKKYVGSAYNDIGIWSRWSAYAATGHGWNVALVELIADKGIAYARENFRMTLLEAWPYRTEDKVIISRETHWKEALLTRGDFGYNRN